MIKNKKATTKDSISEYYSVYAPNKDWLEVEDGYLDLNINTDFTRTISEEAPTFRKTHKPLENEIIKQLRKERQ